ncbi:MAG: drug/metabolite transporter (DMT)-like permease [Gammaproteobacteria bacterium]
MSKFYSRINVPQNDPQDRFSREQLIGVILVLLGALSIGIMPSAAKIAYQEGANPIAAILMRSLVGLTGLAIYMTWRNIRFHLERKNIKRSFATGIVQSLSSLGIMGSVAYIDISLAVLIIFCFPFIVILYNQYKGHSKMTPSVMLSFFVAIFGLGLALSVDFALLNPVGIMLSVLGMFAMAAMVLMVSSVTRNIGAIPATFQMTSWTSFIFLLVVLFSPYIGILEEASYPSSARGWIAIFAAGFSFILGYVFFFLGANIIGTSRASMLSITEPVMIVLVAVVVVDEWLSPLQWFGLVLVVGSLLVIELPRKRRGDPLSS